MRKILVVLGTRPEAIKMAPLVEALSCSDSRIDLKICVTGQHGQMLQQALEVFGLAPDFDLNIMKSGQDLFDITASVLLQMRGVLSEVKPDLVMVHGDTTTSLCAALAAFYLKIKVAHIEAGLRTRDIFSPFPEELNRTFTARIADLHFAPTEISRQNLLGEGVQDSDIFVVGNTAIDALHFMRKRIEDDTYLRARIQSQLNNKTKFDVSKDRFILITGHRRENFGKGFINICDAISELADKYKSLRFVYPVHLNPNVQGPVNRILGRTKNVVLMEPVGYDLFNFLLAHCVLVLTDSGGVQEEAPSFGKPVLVMRGTTERPEAITAGVAKLVGINREEIVKSVSEVLDTPSIYSRMVAQSNPFGDGKTSERIGKIIHNYLFGPKFK